MLGFSSLFSFFPDVHAPIPMHIRIRRVDICEGDFII